MPPAYQNSLFGRHAVGAALKNPQRGKKRLFATREARRALPDNVSENISVPVSITDKAELDKMAGRDAHHQGLVLEVEPLPGVFLEDYPPRTGQKNLIVALDHITDPHNVGAIMRSAAAFGAIALVTTDRHSPGETAALAKSASGALDILPWARVTNLARSLDQLAETGYWRIGLDGTAQQNLSDVDLGDNLVLVIGAEGEGLRHNTKKHCDLLARIPISGAIESLNASNAAAVALYELSRS